MSLIDIALEAAGSDSSLLRRTISKIAVDKLASSTSPRPLPFSLWSPVPKPADPATQGPVCDYTSWPGLTDRTFSSRHLPPCSQADIDALASNGGCDPSAGAIGPFTALFKRPDTGMKKDRSSVLFSYFAQWFTDSFLRTASPDRRRNTSNHEIDLCQIYGLEEETTRQLRALQGGLLASQQVDGQEYPDALYELDAHGKLAPKARYAALPYVLNGQLDWILAQQGVPAERKARLYATGLERGNSAIGYVTMSTVFLREHNRLCRGLQAANPGWDDERLFQTARMINIVQLLRIVIEDYINHIAGHKLFVFDNSFGEGQPWYRTNWMAIEFDLLYRWHGLVPETVNVGGVPFGPKDFQTNNALLESLGLAAFLDGAGREQAGKICLFNTPVFLLGAECQSVKMGRDFRLQGFNAYRRAFGLHPVTSWEGLTRDGATRAALAAVYKDVDQLELVVGLLAEDASEGALFGTLMNTMVASDAFTQALTNPLLSKNVFNARTFTDYGLAQIAATPSLQSLVNRNVAGGADIRATFDFHA
ncbi:MAG: peroxidase family protein [Betaproteobacteria bacterium]